MLIPNIARDSSANSLSNSNNNSTNTSNIINGNVKKTSLEGNNPAGVGKSGAKKPAGAAVGAGGAGANGLAGPVGPGLVGGVLAALLAAPPTAAVDSEDTAAEDLPYWPVLPKINSVNKFPEQTIIVPGENIIN